ncbi:hypothetical protein F5887DRAFT_1170315 [Amanita rubescens]|nr:hypothetical protein F5887DRAFT_1170315 [Amanita rubescens]
MSTKTRPPAFFDKHFSEKLKLLRVTRLPSLAHDIAAIVDKTIMDSFNDNVQFPPCDTLLSARQRNSAVSSIGRDMADEKAVASFYERTTATFCAPVASTLALRVSDWDSLLVWTQSANVSGYAIADGFLTFAGPTSLAEREAELRKVMDEETFRLFGLLSTRRTSLVTNGFKHMAAGGPEILLAIPNLSNSPSFDWTSCNAPECASMTNYKKERDKVKEVFVEPDAKKTPWTFPNNPMSPSGSETVRPTTPDASPVSVSIAINRELQRPRFFRRRHAVYGFDATTIATSRRCKSGNRFSKGEGEGRTRPHEVDGSIIVLQSGNHEFIGIRHRATRTLYISDLINPHACKEPSYGKLHVGLYIAGLKDALDRERQVHSAQPPGGDNGPSGSGGNGPSGSGGNGPSGSGGDGPSGSGGNGCDKQDGPSGGGPGSGHRNKMAIAAHEMAAKSTLELASGRNVILLYLQYGIYDSSAPSTFVRSGPIGHPTSLPSQETVQNYQLEECLTIVLRSEIGHGATGQVLRGTLEVEASECALLDVAVKLALASGQREALRDEYEIYRQLRSKGVTAGITTPLGLFDDVEGGACILVMPYVGAPLAATPELVLPYFISVHCYFVLFLPTFSDKFGTGKQFLQLWQKYIMPTYSTAILVWTTYLWLIRV